MQLEANLAASEIDLAKWFLVNPEGKPLYARPIALAQSAINILSKLKREIGRDSNTDSPPELTLSLDRQIAKCLHIHAVSLLRDGKTNPIDFPASNALDQMNGALDLMNQVFVRDLQNGDTQCDQATVDFDLLHLMGLIKSHFKNNVPKQLNLPETDKIIERLDEVILVVRALSSGDKDNNAWRAKLATLYRGMGRTQSS